MAYAAGQQEGGRINPVKSPRIKSPKHLERIRELPCLLCKRSPVDAAHIRYGSLKYRKRSTGMGEKPSDFWTVPLCRECHTTQHSMNEEKFWHESGVDPLLVSLLLYAYSGDHFRMEDLVWNTTSTYDVLTELGID